MNHFIIIAPRVNVKVVLSSRPVGQQSKHLQDGAVPVSLLKVIGSPAMNRRPLLLISCEAAGRWTWSEWARQQFQVDRQDEEN